MSSPQIPFNFIPTNPHLTDALNLLKRDIMLNLCAHHIGQVQEFDAEQQTCSATINYPKTYFDFDEDSSQYVPVLVNYPVMLDCPVISLGGGAGALTMPIQEGDECLVLFNDRDFGNWFQGGSGSAVSTPRTHSFSDGIILVGIRSLANVLDNFDLVRAVLRGGAGVVGVNTDNDKILITNAEPDGDDGDYSYDTTLGTILQQLNTQLTTLCSNLETLCSDIQAITVLCSAPGSPSGVPVNAAAFAAVSTQIGTVSSNISNVATALGGLLE